MLYFESNRQAAEYNLALEETLFESRRGEEIFLLWRDGPSAIVGKFQNAFREINALTAHRMGVPVVRRESGGGCVYHDLGNINYCLMVEGDRAPGYDPFLEIAVRALRRLGIPAQRRGVCEIVAEGKKISGNAQRRSRGRTLHHGTLLFDADLDALRGLTSCPDDAVTSKGVFSQPSEVANMRRYFPGSAEDFLSAFREMVLPRGEALTLTREEAARAESLQSEKYSRWEWNFGRSPGFCRCRGDLRYRANRGVIEEFFWRGTRVSAFEGARLEISEVESLCASEFSSQAERDLVFQSIF